jgi:hypothetical protein
LNRASFTPYLTSGDLINLSGTDLEVEIAFDPNTARTVAPILSALRFLIVSDSEVDGFIIDDATEFGRGSAENVVIDTSPVAVSLETPVYVDSYYFALENAVNQIHENTTTTPSFAQAELSVIGANTPISPNQVFRAVETNSGKVSLANFAWPRSVKRLTNRSFVVADTFNDRVLELDEDGVLVNGFGSINYEHSDKIFPIAACVDSRSDILYIVWSKPIPFVSVVVSKIVLQASQSGTTTRVQLVVDSDKILNKTTEELEQTNPSGQIMPVYLGTHNAALAKSFPATSSYCTVSQDAVAGGVSSDSVFYDKIKFTNGIPLFVGNFAYIDGVFSPTFADKTDTGSFIVANGTLGVKSYSFPAASFPSGTTESIALSTNCSGIVEVDSTNTITFASNVMNFSPFVPGRVEFLDTNTLLIGGIRPGGQEKKDNLDFRNVSGDSTNKRSQKSVLNEVFFGGSTAFSGAVLVYDRQNSSTLFEYISPEGLLVSDVDVDPIESSFVVAESCFSSSGRIIKVDMSGNITWSFGEGLYSIINSVKVQYDGSMVIST